MAKAGKPSIRLVPVVEAPLTPRQPGRLKGLLGNISEEAIMAPCFTDEEIDAFEDADIFPPST